MIALLRRLLSPKKNKRTRLIVRNAPLISIERAQPKLSFIRTPGSFSPDWRRGWLDGQWNIKPDPRYAMNAEYLAGWNNARNG